MNQIQVEDQVDKVVMPDNLKVGLMVAEQREKCASGGCTEEFTCHCCKTKLHSKSKSKKYGL